MIKFDVRNRFGGEVKFTAEIDCAEDAPVSIKLGLAVRWALKTGASLVETDLAGADLAGANMADAYMAGAYMAGANMAGANMADANMADANMADANMAGAYMAGANMAGANMAGANMAGAYMADANMAGAYMAGANMAGANMADAYMAGANMAGALQIDPADIPVIENIDAAICRAIDAGGDLDMGMWHGGDDNWCGTTHCRAGWAISLAGEKGKALQDRVGPQMAGTLIYHASRPGVPAPHFFADNESAMADLRRCAAEQGYVAP